MTDERITTRIEWQDEERPWAHHDALWPEGVRVPVPGEYVGVAKGGDDLRAVKVVMWALDGSCVVRLEAHPR